ncbi:VanZ family protein [Quadrisphaera sp. DSM 44207]|uniref:VanZ family protein n=1 Tax=Quadrisphaera sp. DSM 44207 TaxID=1881057 RepID=UPI000887524D|nr:VanZ family protein [Quadrisphaera sp. DSM 44207]SDQ73080.1 hypothetical protein SAMN05428996_2579 [Quadrisphaera sp. DSM 44207]
MSPSRTSRLPPLGSLLARAVLALAVLVHLVVLYAPRAPSGGGTPGVDKVVHVAVFALVVWAGRWARLARRPLVLVLLGHALVSEALQHWLLPARSGDSLDVLADAAGVALGALLAVPRPPARAMMQPWPREGRRAGR